MMEIWFSNIYLMFNNIYYAYIELLFFFNLFCKKWKYWTLKKKIYYYIDIINHVD